MLGIGSCLPKIKINNTSIVKELIDDFGYYLSENDKKFLEYSFIRKLDFLEIESRGIYSKCDHETSISMSLEAAKKALEDAECSAQQIDLLLFTGVCNPFREPTYAMILAEQLGMNNINCYDVGDACNGFLKAFELADLYINAGKANKILIVTCESSLEMLDTVRDSIRVKSVDEADYKMNLLFAGTGAAAVVLAKDNKRKRILYYKEQRSSMDWDISFFVSPQIMIPNEKMNGENIVTWSDGRKIAAKIISDMPVVIDQFIEENRIDKDEIKYIFCHQLGRNITYAILNKLKVDIDKIFPVNTFKEYGNMGSANIPVSLDIADKNGLLQEGDSILLLGSSCGISYTAVNIIW